MGETKNWTKKFDLAAPEGRNSMYRNQRWDVFFFSQSCPSLALEIHCSEPWGNLSWSKLEYKLDRPGHKSEKLGVSFQKRGRWHLCWVVWEGVSHVYVIPPWQALASQPTVRDSAVWVLKAVGGLVKCMRLKMQGWQEEVKKNTKNKFYQSHFDVDLSCRIQLPKTR